jgi:putative SOS response-associated peptidase YedK
MCFYYALVKSNPKALIDNKIITANQLSVFPDQKMIKGFDYPLLPVISSENPNAIEMFQWGFVPSHMGSKQRATEFLKQYNTLNAKAETLFESRLYGDSIMKKRCLVLCSGFFEWRHKDPKKKNSEKYPFYVTLKDESMFVFGGIWEKYEDRETSEMISTYAIITTPANELMEIVHNLKKRMPLILEPENALAWLDNSLSEKDIKSLIKPFDASKMKAKPVRKINPKLDYKIEPGIHVYYHYEELTSLLTAYPDFFEKSVDLRNTSPTLF